jgi:hypothetical protein
MSDIFIFRHASKSYRENPRIIDGKIKEEYIK